MGCFQSQVDAEPVIERIEPGLPKGVVDKLAAIETEAIAASQDLEQLDKFLVVFDDALSKHEVAVRVTRCCLVAAAGIGAVLLFFPATQGAGIKLLATTKAVRVITNASVVWVRCSNAESLGEKVHEVQQRQRELARLLKELDALRARHGLDGVDVLQGVSGLPPTWFEVGGTAVSAVCACDLEPSEFFALLTTAVCVKEAVESFRDIGEARRQGQQIREKLAGARLALCTLASNSRNLAA